MESMVIDLLTAGVKRRQRRGTRKEKEKEKEKERQRQRQRQGQRKGLVSREPELAWGAGNCNPGELERVEQLEWRDPACSPASSSEPGKSELEINRVPVGTLDPSLGWKRCRTRRHQVDPESDRCSSAPWA